nr:unnamed protein product [Haemonchus contortus]
MQRRITDIFAILSKNNEQLKHLGIVIREIEKELMKAERQIQDSKQYDQAETHKRMAFSLHRTVQRQHDEIITLKQKIDKLEASKTQHEEQLHQHQQVLEETKRSEAQAEIPDKSYLERMIEEVEEDRMEDLPSLEDVSSDDEDDRMGEVPALEDISSDGEDNRGVDGHDSTDDRTSINRLQEDLWEMGKALKKFPYRMIGDTKEIASDKSCAFCGKIKRTRASR